MMSGRLVVWQPVYYPKLHYLARLARADEFVVFDTAEFSRQSRQHRAPIEYGGKTWLTIPIHHGDDSSSLREVKIDMSKKWGRKHLMTLQAKYGGNASDMFADLYESLDTDATLNDITVPLLLRLLEQFDIEIAVTRASELDVPYERGEPSEFLARVTEHLGYETYYCGKRAYENYLQQDPFEQRGIAIETQDWEPTWSDGNTICLDALFGSSNPAQYVE